MEGRETVLQRVVRATDPAFAPYAAADPAGGRPGERLDDPDREFVLEAIYEGYVMHYGEPRAFTGMDPDLRLLAGDALYALGLSRLAELGDLHAVAELADLITLCARAHAEGRAELVDDLWAASSRAVSGAGGPGAMAAISSRLAP